MVIRFAAALCCLLTLTTTAPVADQSFADRLYDNGDYNWAHLEYERMLYTAHDTATISHWRYRSGKCLMQTGHYAMAISAFSVIPTGNPLADSAALQSTLCELRRGDITNAERHLSTCRLTYTKIVRGYIAFLSKHYAAALDTLKSIPNDSPDAFTARSLEQAVSASSFKRKSYAPALVLSIIPGCGHLYSANRGDAAMTALTVATGVLITGYYAWYDRHPYRAITAGSITGLLHLGGMYGALMSVKLYNRNAMRRQHAIAERIIFGQ